MGEFIAGSILLLGIGMTLEHDPEPDSIETEIVYFTCSVPKGGIGVGDMLVLRCVSADETCWLSGGRLLYCERNTTSVGN